MNSEESRGEERKKWCHIAIPGESMEPLTCICKHTQQCRDLLKGYSIFPKNPTTWIKLVCRVQTKLCQHVAVLPWESYLNVSVPVSALSAVGMRLAAYL